MKKVALKKRYETMTTMLDAFDFARIQEYYGLMILLKDLEISDDEFQAWVRYMRIEGNRVGPAHKKKVQSYYCPDCGDKLTLMPVNTKSCTDVGEGYKSMFSCDNQMECGYSRYSEDTVEKWLETLTDMSKHGAMSKMKNEASGCSGCGGKS